MEVASWLLVRRVAMLKSVMCTCPANTQKHAMKSLCGNFLTPGGATPDKRRTPAKLSISLDQTNSSPDLVFFFGREFRTEASTPHKFTPYILAKS